MNSACEAAKTCLSFAAALMGGKGTIWAFDRDAKRLERLEANAETTGATNIVAQQVYTVTLRLQCISASFTIIA